MQATINNIDTLENVNALIVKVKQLIKTSIGVIKMGWVSFLAECEAWINAYEATANTFVEGKTYICKYITNSDMETPITITKRTKCFVHFVVDGEKSKAKIQNYRGVELIYPYGKYSMCPVLKASRLL